MPQISLFIDRIDKIKVTVCLIFGTIGSLIASAFGGWNHSLSTLIILMVVDYVSGVVVAGVFHKSKKTKTGALSSKAGAKGLSRKVYTIVLVFVCHRIDMALGTNYVRDLAAIGFIANEAISIFENAKLMGMKLPPVIDKALDVLAIKSSNPPDEKSK